MARGGDSYVKVGGPTSESMPITNSLIYPGFSDYVVWCPPGKLAQSNVHALWVESEGAQPPPSWNLGGLKHPLPPLFLRSWWLLVPSQCGWVSKPFSMYILQLSLYCNISLVSSTDTTCYTCLSSVWLMWMCWSRLWSKSLTLSLTGQWVVSRIQ